MRNERTLIATEMSFVATLRIAMLSSADRRRCTEALSRGSPMCLAIPGRVIEIVDVSRQIVKAEVSGVRRNISAELLGKEGERDSVRVGDWVLIHAGFALARINEEEARATTQLFQAMADAYADELGALGKSQIE